MDDRADNSQELRLEPYTVPTGPATARPAAAPTLTPQPAPATPLSPGVPGERIEPVFSAYEYGGADHAPGMFDASPRALASPPPSLLPAVNKSGATGFFPPGTGLLPAGLLPPAGTAGAFAFAAPSAPAGRVEPPFAPRPAPVRGLSAPSQTFSPPAQPVQRARVGDVQIRDWVWYARKLGRGIALLAAGWAALVAVLIVVYRFADPPLSALMLQRYLSGEQANRTWMPIDAISPSLVRAVMISEDGRFCQHAGIDLEAMQTAIERAGEGTPRGASTITMQVVKNLFLWPSKSYLRKALEVPLTLAVEFMWSKRRIMEIYLNIAEWGPGTFGAEAAARYHFSKSSRQLSDRESALLAVTLPNPIRRDAGKPGPGTRRLASLIQARAGSAARSQMSCVLVPFRRN